MTMGAAMKKPPVGGRWGRNCAARRQQASSARCKSAKYPRAHRIYRANTEGQRHRYCDAVRPALTDSIGPSRQSWQHDGAMGIVRATASRRNPQRRLPLCLQSAGSC